MRATARVIVFVSVWLRVSNGEGSDWREGDVVADGCDVLIYNEGSSRCRDM